MIAKPCTRFAVRIRFADESAPRYVHMSSRDLVGTSSEPSLRICHADEESAAALLRRAGSPWSIPLAEAPHVVEVDVTEQLQLRAEQLRAELASITQELEDAKR